MNFQIGTVTFTRPLVWVNRDDFPELAQTRARTVGGGQVVFDTPIVGGRPIILRATRNRGWPTQAQIDALKAMARQQGSTWAFVYGLFNATIEFDHSEGPAVSMQAILPRTEPAATDINEGTIRLRTV